MPRLSAPQLSLKRPTGVQVGPRLQAEGVHLAPKMVSKNLKDELGSFVVGLFSDPKSAPVGNGTTRRALQLGVEAQGNPMTFLWHQVSPPLQGDINFLYALRESMPYRRDQIFPTASTDLKINFGEPWHMEDPYGEGAPTVLGNGWCMGIWDHHHVVGWPARTDFVGVSFKPGGAQAFLGVPMSELHNRVVPLDAIWGRAAAQIRQQLFDAKTVERRFALLEEFLLARWRATTGAAQIVNHVSARIIERHGSGTIGELRADIAVSHKHLITLFNRLVGCTPKELARLSRFHHALDSIDVAEPASWTSVAYDNDFFDQSHFTRDFAAFSGLNPTDYLARRRAIHAERPEHALLPWLLPIG